MYNFLTNTHHGRLKDAINAIKAKQKVQPFFKVASDVQFKVHKVGQGSYISIKIKKEIVIVDMSSSAYKKEFVYHNVQSPT